MISERAVEAIESSDTDDLLRVIDGYCKSRAWPDLLELRSRCHEAVGRGKQLWGVEEHIRYRLALEAPGEVAGPIVAEGESRFALGPLPEVAASTKSWAELSRTLDHGPARRTTAAERVIRGDVIDGESLDLPGEILDWEPAYEVATYKSNRVEAPAPKIPAMTDVDLPDAAETIRDQVSEEALSDLVMPWVEESNGRCETVTTAGDHLAAIRGLGLTAVRVGDLTTAGALAWMAWAAASGGAHGRRRGAATGRYMAWWVVSCLADLQWPDSPTTIASEAGRLSWHWFDDGSPQVGWSLRLAITDSDAGISWAVAAADLD